MELVYTGFLPSLAELDSKRLVGGMPGIAEVRYILLDTPASAFILCPAAPSSLLIP